MISVDTVFCTLRVKADRFALCHGNSHSAVSLLHAHFRENRKRLDTLVCKHPYHTLRVKADRFALCHGNSHSATTLLHAHFRGHHKRPHHQLCKHMMVRSFLLSLTLKLYSFSGGSSCVVWMFYFGHFGDVVSAFEECVGHVMTCHDDLESAWFVFYEFYQFFFA